MRKIATILFLFLSAAAKAQTTDTPRVQLNVFSSLGLSTVDNSFEPVTGNSIQTTTGLELAFLRHSSIGVALSFDSYRYQKTGISYTQDESLRATSLALFYRYKFGTSKWQPFLKAGGGTTWLTVPVVSASGTTTNIVSQTKNVGMALGEAGLQARLHPKYSFLFSVEHKWMAKSSLLDNQSIGATGFKIGITSSF